MNAMTPIATTTIASGPAGAPGATPLSGGATGMFAALPGGSFFDLITAKFAANAQVATTPASVNATENIASQLSTGATVNLKAGTTIPAPAARPQGGNALAMLQVALASQKIDADGNIVVSSETGDAATLKTQLDFTNQIIDHVQTLSGEDGAAPDGLLAKILAKLQNKSETLQASLSTLESGGVIAKDTPVQDIPLPMMIAIGLKPSEIAQVTDKLDSLQKKLGREITVEDLIAGIGGIMPPLPQQAAVVAAGSLAPSRTVRIDAPESIESVPTDTPARGLADGMIGALGEDSAPDDELAARLNALDVGAGDEAMDGTLGKFQLEDTGAGETAPGLPVKKTDAVSKDNFVGAMNTEKSTKGEMVFPLALFGGDADASIYNAHGLSASPSLSYGPTAQAASTITSPASAGQPHPATNLVAASIVKFADKSGDQTMQIRLDPPELGNLSVRLQFGKDKSVKAHLTVEKAETLVMLQRDGFALERALHSAGLDAQAGSITFELAGHGNDGFGNNNEAGGDGTSGRGDAGTGVSGDAGEIIQSSVTWQVDPSTGHVRYNLLA